VEWGVLKTIILAAGRPRRELSVLVPPGRNKVLLRILGKPIISYPIDSVSSVTRDEIILVYRKGEETVYHEAAEYASTVVKPVPQESGNSVADAVLSAASEIDSEDHFMLVFGDIIFPAEAVREILSTHLREAPDATILTVPLIPEHASTYGLVSVNDEGYVENIVEEPTSIPPEAVYISGGIYVLPTTILDYLEKGLNFTQSLRMIANHGRMKTVYWTGLWVDIGYPWDLLEAVHQLLYGLKNSKISRTAEIESTAVIEGPVIIDDGAYIDHYAVIKGPVYIGRESFIGAHSFVRHYSNLEHRTRVGSYAEVKNTITQPYTLLDSKVILADSIIGENTIIGAGSITLNILPHDEKPPRLRTHLVKPVSLKVQKMKLGAVIGYDVKINPNTILKPGSILKPKSIIEHIKPLQFNET
jgi:NDP-sugar pyrophosphorylase family protein